MFENRPFYVLNDCLMLIIYCDLWIYVLHVLPILNAGEYSRSYWNRTHKRVVVINACAQEEKYQNEEHWGKGLTANLFTKKILNAEGDAGYDVDKYINQNSEFTIAQTVTMTS